MKEKIIRQSARVRKAAGDREAARESARAIQERFGRARFLETFDALYAAANGDPAGIPWADLEPHPALVRWLEENGPHAGLALEVGCGLGDNAAALSRVGYDVTAFDISARAVEWARRRWRETGKERIDFRRADLLEPPPRWRGGFDLVHETYTLQSLPVEIRAAAFSPLAGFLRPGGRLLLICRFREAGEPLSGPPWPLSEEELAKLEAAGLEPLERERFVIKGGRDVPHMLSLWRKAPER